MALDTEVRGKVTDRLAADVALPRMFPARQRLDDAHIQPQDIPAAVRSELGRDAVMQRIRPGMSVAITAGSRGVTNYAAVIRAIADFVKMRGAHPFVFPAMGSHGGATAEGQRGILAGYGITEETMGCPIRATMETVYLGDTPEGMRVYGDRYACAADAVILCNRVKPHTAFEGPYESGLMKMSVIGLGKQHGAEQVHRDGFSDLGRLLPMIGRVVFDHAPIALGVGLVENAFDDTCLVRALTAEEIWREEPRLLDYARSRMGKIHTHDLDLLVVDRIGKDMSGDGMDPHITGRFAVPHMKGKLRAQHIAVLDLTEETHGNCNGIGLADVTTKRLVDKIDVNATFPNVVTSTVLCTPKIPLFAASDRACIQIALRTCNYIDREHPRVVRIRDTKHIGEIRMSEALLAEASADPNLEVIGPPEDWPFDAEGNLW
jgi:hypothetical protein